MKKLQVFLLALGLFVGTGTVMASEVLPVPMSPESTQEISKLLKNPKFTVADDCRATVEFVMNKHGEMVILTVDAEDKQLEKFLISRLNYQTLESPLEIGKTYTLPIKLVAIF
ncbi:MAG: hypothetical protein CMC08_03820 [Flavobacteriaceae bacterium]|nr:hypothetical protein [Flavobacteriaceae bacterium]|tara:strand:- start:327 stop:665 length:339 start_codon:yes stop_codon:yes gene_type:complete